MHEFGLTDHNLTSLNLVLLNLDFSDKRKDNVFLFVLRKFSYFLSERKTFLISWKMHIVVKLIKYDVLL